MHHYRGTVELADVGGPNRIVNQLDVDHYLRGVVPAEVPASWGSAGGGAGMNALRPKSVAARSFAISQNRYSYAKTCDTHRARSTAAPRHGLRPRPPVGSPSRTP